MIPNDEDTVGYVRDFYVKHKLRYGCALGTVRLLSKKWSNLAEPFRFKFADQDYGVGIVLLTADFAHCLSRLRNFVDPHIFTTEIVVHEEGYEPDFAILIAELSNHDFPPPPLRSLSIPSSSIVASASAFASIFSSTLESLSLAENEQGYGRSHGFTNGEVFPHLRVLRIAAWHWQQAIESVSRSIFPALQVLEVEAREAALFFPIKEVVNRFGAQLRTLRVHLGWPLEPEVAQELAGRLRDVSLPTPPFCFDTRPPASLPDVLSYDVFLFLLEELETAKADEEYREWDIRGVQVIARRLELELPEWTC
ncbi:hypothetical protein JCM8547_000463 [Rhodosporidiobolus lusitaniae]